MMMMTWSKASEKWKAVKAEPAASPANDIIVKMEVRVTDYSR